MSTVRPERKLVPLNAEQNRVVRSHLDEILTSHAFFGSPRAQQFLKLIVEHALDGEIDQLRERMIGAEMFGRPVGYDTGSDPVVRVKASEVRKKLAQFYSEAGHSPDVKIEVPSGSYVPHFTFSDPPPESLSPATAESTPTHADPSHDNPGPSVAAPPGKNTRSRNWHWIMGGLIGITVVLAGVIFTLHKWQKGADGETQIRSLAVLAFENESGRPDEEYFADGITDELITQMGQVTRLRITSRTSAMSFKGSRRRLPEIARELGVDAIVEGTVQRQGNQVRITAQLIDARDDRLLWARTYDRALTNVLALEGELANNIADQVRGRVSPHAQTAAAPATEINVRAEDLYLRGIQQLNANRCPAAISLFEQSVAADDRLAAAHAAMATCYGQLGERGVIAYSDAFSRQKAEAMRAIELDDSLAEGHTELANAAMNLSWDWSLAAREFDRALELNPSSAMSHERHAIYLERVGRLDEAVTEAERGMVLDPVSDRSFAEAAFTYYFARRYDHALELHSKARASGIFKEDSMFLLGDVYAEKGQFAKSIPAFLSGGDTPHALGHLGNAYARSGQTSQARAVIHQLEAHVRTNGLGRYEIALVYAGLGENNMAFAWLEESLNAHNEGLTNLKIDPCLDPLRADPRFQDLMHRVGLPAN